MHSAEAAVCVPIILVVFLTGIILTVKTYRVADRQTAVYEKEYESESISKTEIIRIAEAVNETFFE